MSLDLIHRLESLTHSFEGPEWVTEKVAKFRRKSRGRVFGSVYVDLTGKIPSSMEELSDYLDRIVAGGYFADEVKLQWNTYLYFVVNSQVTREERGVIEKDRRYARKFVGTEEEVFKSLNFELPGAQRSSESIGVFSRWIEKLSEAGLDRLILDEDSLAERIRCIEGGVENTPRNLSLNSSAFVQDVPQAIQKVDLNRFREFPKVRSFKLGAATLISGVNGAGKTSLLEAIEVVFCGNTRRNRGNQEDVDLEVTWQDGAIQNISGNRPIREFRERNLNWYGVVDSLRAPSTLVESFARFNFLDTDAAVRVARSAEGFEAALPGLLIGQSAAKCWREMERTREELSRRVKRLTIDLNEAAEDYERLQSDLNESKSVGYESAVLYQSLSTVAKGVGFELDGSEPDIELVSQLVSSLVEMESEFEAIGRLQFDGEDRTISDIKSRLVEQRGRVARAEELLSAQERLNVTLRATSSQKVEVSKKKKLLLAIKEYIESGFIDRVRDRESLEVESQRLRVALAGVNLDEQEFEFEKWGEYRLDSALRESQSALASARADWNAASAELTAFRSQLAAREKMLEEFRDLALDLITEASDQCVCPLCHQEFDEGELLRRIKAHSGPDLGSQADALRDAEDAASRVLVSVENDQRALSMLVTFCRESDMSIAMSVAQIAGEIKSSRDRCDLVQKGIARLDEEIHALSSSSFSEHHWDDLVVDARHALDLESDAPLNLEAIDLASVDLELDEIRSQCRSIEERIGEVNREISELLRVEVDPRLFADEASQLRRRVESLASAMDRVELFSSGKSWSTSDSLVEVSLSIRQARIAARNYLDAAGRESEASILRAKFLTEIERASTRRSRVQSKLRNIRRAHEVLEEIAETDSLSKATDRELAVSKEMIEEIFRRIHAPAEFRGIGPEIGSLVRSQTGEITPMSQVSTGQRAAFALSLFLAQNLRLVNGPRVVLIDDPVAHIDDLNALSFLDFLREIVIRNERQIVFATADEKLANLFEKKFAFLGGEEFVRYDLSR